MSKPELKDQLKSLESYFNDVPLNTIELLFDLIIIGSVTGFIVYLIYKSGR